MRIYSKEVLIMSWIETAIEIAGSAFYGYDDPEEAIRHIRERVEMCPDVVLMAKVYDTIEDARVRASDIYSKAREQLIKEKPQPNETMDDMVKRLAFWIIYTKAVEYYKYMKEE
jgi:hypothetical protein